jgi:hypothetical protein
LVEICSEAEYRIEPYSAFGTEQPRAAVRFKGQVPSVEPTEREHGRDLG